MTLTRKILFTVGYLAICAACARRSPCHRKSSAERGTGPGEQNEAGGRGSKPRRGFEKDSGLTPCRCQASKFHADRKDADSGVALARRRVGARLPIPPHVPQASKQERESALGGRPSGRRSPDPTPQASKQARERERERRSQAHWGEQTHLQPREGPFRRTGADRVGVGLQAGRFAPRPPASKQQRERERERA